MKRFIQFAFLFAISIGLLACNPQTKKNNTESEQDEVSAEMERPTDADFLAFMVYHHMDYMKTTAKEAGGTNKLLYTRKLPTEGTDPVVTPALDHIYTKAVIDLTEGPVTITFPKVEKGRYYSIHITDEEHYTIYDEVFPIGAYVFIRKGAGMDIPEEAKAIECDGNYPHLFIRVQVFTNDDLVNVHPIQDKITLEGVSKTLEFDNLIVNPAGSEGMRFLMATVGVGVENEKIQEELHEFDLPIRDRITSVLEEQTLDALTSPGARENLKVILAEAVAPFLEGQSEFVIYIPHFVIQ